MTAILYSIRNIIIYCSWHSQSDGGLAFGIIMSFIIAFFSVSFNFFRDRILVGSRIKVTIAFLINYLIKLIVMFIIKTMNAWVCGVVIIGIVLGQIGFEYVSRVKKWKKASGGQDQTSLRS